MRSRTYVATWTTVLIVAAACGGARSPDHGVSRRKHDSRIAGENVAGENTAPGAAAGNITRAAYVGSARCAKCHAELYDAWASSPMHRMTRDAHGAEIRAPFGADARRAQYNFKSDVARFETDIPSGERYVSIHSANGDSALFRVTKVLGGHHREDFVGLRVAARGGPPVGDGVEQVLPVSFVYGGAQARGDHGGASASDSPGESAGAFRYKGYSVMLPERFHLGAGPAWKQTCIFCHNTAPYLSSLFGALAGRSRAHYQGEVVDALLPNAQRWRYEVMDPRALAQSIESELLTLRAPLPLTATAPAPLPPNALLARAISETRERFDQSQLIELGVGCEACHGAGGDHAEHPDHLPSFTPRASWLRISPEPSRAQAINHVCARCHQVLFSRYPWTWEGGRRNENAGGSPISSGEGRDFLLGGCASELACTACHSPHAKDEQAHLREIDSVKGNAICLTCHTQFREQAKLRAHSHHDPSGAAGVCIRCHMAKKNMTLDSTLGPYHRIGSPTDAVRVLGDRPLECALCHGEKSVESLVTQMETWWNKSYDRSVLRAMYGNLAEPALIATLIRGKPHEKAVALQLLGESRDVRAAALIAREVVNPYPLVREYAKKALERVLGHPSGIDLSAPRADIEASARRCLTEAKISAPAEAWGDSSPPLPADPNAIESGED